MKLKGAQILIKMIKAQGVDTIFGYPGGAVIDIYDELSRHDDLRHILVRHEQGAIHAADGYARATGRVGVCLVTSGPGATNTVTGIATAYMDSIPVVIITGQVPTRPDRQRRLPGSGHRRHLPALREAQLPGQGREGPGLDHQAGLSIWPAPAAPDRCWWTCPRTSCRPRFEYPESISMRSYNPQPRNPTVGSCARSRNCCAQPPAAVLLRRGRDFLGRLRRADLAGRTLRIPVTSTLMGLGAFPGDDPLWLGMLGMHGTYAANMAVGHTDLLVAVGARFDDRVTGKISSFAPIGQGGAY
jgi:acetolactate synthase I/II/III large subunit